MNMFVKGSTLQGPWSINDHGCRRAADHHSFVIACAVLSTLFDCLLDEGNSKTYLLVFYR